METPQDQPCTKPYAANAKPSARYLLNPAAVNRFFAETVLKVKAAIQVQKDPSATNHLLVNAILKKEVTKEKIPA